MGKKAHQRVKPTLPTPTGNLIHLPPNSSRAHMPIGAVLRLRSSRTPPPGYARRPTPLSSQPHSCASASPVRVTCCTSASSRPHDEPRLCLLPAAACPPGHHPPLASCWPCPPPLPGITQRLWIWWGCCLTSAYPLRRGGAPPPSVEAPQDEPSSAFLNIVTCEQLICGYI